MPKGAKKRAKLKQQQQQGHPDDGGNNTHNGNGSSDNNTSSRRDGDRHHLRIPPNVPHVDVSEDSMESSEEMVTPRAAASEADEEERKATSEVTVERAVEVIEEDGAGAGEAGEEVMVDALPPETGRHERDGKVYAEVEVHAVVQEPEVKDVVVAEAPSVQEPEVAESPVVLVPEVEEVVAARETPVAPLEHEPEVKGDVAAVVETVSAPPVQEPETKGRNVVVKDSAEVSRSREAVDVHTTEVVRGPAVAVAALGQRATWWNCCGLFDAFSGSER
ncbi:uncharacterized protein LOC133918715 [Phragmites australis]|uniref:uncharacterized protein LOC133918715 n=1 Tax=Phragmites australis TaxID=29695 RepID=UPI002D7960C7|nr:uncharacterized protein LOC133918715 [Phragmites australis]